ncbi:PglZ domain-containing protein [Clostridium lacusfryxellense]|uniref:PglZ domain-containing protein n=1 Tax=Clostridium lacusfryxellense TaxID=205328 RepID=UPI001C0B69F0|nr:PglZ domain-containing protein [Clostridium lacusfryxellense]MBU3114586.1 PglZ domain-containing protein [Clostridium lacusfryxellense]
MENIIIYSDLQKTYTESCNIIVSKVEDYVDAYVNILTAIYENRSMIIVVQNKQCINYFQRMKEKYKDNITIKINSPKDRFEQLAHIKVPEYISEEEIVNDELYNKVNEISFKKGLSFEENVLSYYLGEYFGNNKFPFQQIVDFLRKLDLSIINSKDKSIILKKIFNNRIREWEESCTECYEKNIFASFVENYKLLFTKLVKYLILKNYPKNIMKDIVGDITKDFDKLHLKSEPFIINAIDTADIQRNVKIYLNHRKLTEMAYKDIVSEIEQLSGLFKVELQFTYSLLKMNKDVIDLAILNKVRAKFKIGLDLDMMFNEKLSNIIPPRKIINPENIDNTNDWISWAIESYLPYRFWLESNDCSNLEADKYASMYGDWIYNNYDSLISSENRMIHKTIANISSLIRKDEVSFIIVIDNFNYKFVPLCKSYLIEKGFNNTIDKPLISMIPTETSVSKTAFFSGEPFNTELKSYEKRCTEWESFLGGKVQYLSDVGKLDAIEEKKAKLYILNYLSIDKILHESQNNSALPISYRIKAELKAMIDKIISFVKRIGVENVIKIYFTSDHGSTKILKDQTNLIDSKYYKYKSEESAYRFIGLTDKKFDIYKNSIGNLCYVLDRNKYGIKENFLIAKGYNRFMETDSSFFVHGGITPEENIIPLLKFERTNVTFIKPEVILRHNEFRYSTTCNINLTIKNYNEYSIDNIKISILNTNIRTQQGLSLIPKIYKQSQMDINIEKIRILRSQLSLDNDRLVIKVKFDFIGKNNDENYEFSIEMKSTQENKINLDDLF